VLSVSGLPETWAAKLALECGKWHLFKRQQVLLLQEKTAKCNGTICQSRRPSPVTGGINKHITLAVTEYVCETKKSSTDS